jgi:hypothetical protein
LVLNLTDDKVVVKPFKTLDYSVLFKKETGDAKKDPK